MAIEMRGQHALIGDHRYLRRKLVANGASMAIGFTATQPCEKRKDAWKEPLTIQEAGRIFVSRQRLPLGEIQMHAEIAGCTACRPVRGVAPAKATTRTLVA